MLAQTNNTTSCSYAIKKIHQYHEKSMGQHKTKQVSAFQSIKMVWRGQRHIYFLFLVTVTTRLDSTVCVCSSYESYLLFFALELLFDTYEAVQKSCEQRINPKHFDEKFIIQHEYGLCAAQSERNSNSKYEHYT